MATREVRDALAEAFWPDQAIQIDAESHTNAPPILGNISEYFVTAYANGDFLSTHTDGASGSLAWVLHLSDDGWGTSGVANGGELRFSAGTRRGSSVGVVDFVPRFNRLLMFLSRPDLTPHQVMPVLRHGAPRFGATGWYITRTDHISTSTQQIMNLMTAAASKAIAGDVCL